MTDELRRKRLKFQAWHRGSREADLLFGPFADAHLSTWTPEELTAFEALLETPDIDLVNWVMANGPLPGDWRDAWIHTVRAFHEKTA